jgi:hypothetical protein
MLDPAPKTVRLPGGRTTTQGADKGVAALLTTSTWLLQSLPGRVVEHQRGAVIQAMAEARDLVVEIAVGRAIRVRNGVRVLVEIPVR